MNTFISMIIGIILMIIGAYLFLFQNSLFSGFALMIIGLLIYIVSDVIGS